MKKQLNKIITWNRGGQTGDQTWKVSRQQTKSSRIRDPTGRDVEPWQVLRFMAHNDSTVDVHNAYRSNTPDP